MIDFRLDPPSGHANSYLDIRFHVDFGLSEYAEIEISNLHTKQPIEILAVSAGFIKNETTVVVKNSSVIEGYINIFNRDKMNTGLSGLTSVDIKAAVKKYTGGKLVSEESQIVSFYNESKSADSEIIPFDLTIHNQTIATESNESLKLTLSSNTQRKHELSIRDSKGDYQYTFDVVTKAGEITVEIPLPVLFNELQLYKIRQRDLHLYWTKFEGVDYVKFMNRKHVKIPNTGLKFVGNKLSPQSQSRMGPMSEILPKTFVLSDRYFVHTYKDFSGFGGQGFDDIRMKRLGFFMHESQDMQAFDKSVSDTANEIRSTLRQDQLSKGKVENFGISNQKKFLENFTGVYQKQTVDSFSTFDFNSQPKTNEQKGGCGCSRKHR